jgi:hypothetical protein
MRIKKKHVLLESLLIDVTTEFDATEKRIFKMMYNHYGNPMYSEEGKKPFNQWDVAAWLIESLEIPYDMAYELTKTYFWNYSRLFSELSSLRKRIPSAELFNDHSRKLTSLFKDNLPPNDSYGEIKINFDRDTGIEDKRIINVWDSYRGVSLYLPFNRRDNYDRYVMGDDRDKRQLIIDVYFHTLDKEGNIVDGYIKDEDYREKIDNEKFRVVVNYTIGEISNRRESGREVKLMEFDVPYPKPLSLKTYSEMLNLILDDVIKKVESFTFKLPSDLEGFGEPSEDSQLD